MPFNHFLPLNNIHCITEKLIKKIVHFMSVCVYMWNLAEEKILCVCVCICCNIYNMLFHAITSNFILNHIINDFVAHRTTFTNKKGKTGRHSSIRGFQFFFSVPFYSFFFLFCFIHNKWKNKRKMNILYYYIRVGYSMPWIFPYFYAFVLLCYSCIIAH